MARDEGRVYRSGQFGVAGGERRPLRMGYNAHLDGRAVVYRLAGLLRWLTHDDWDLAFCQLAGGAGPLDESQGFLFDTVPGGSAPALFSGGLDSALGLAHDLQDGDSVAISVHTNYCMRSVQQRVIRELTKDPARSCMHLQYRVSLHERDRENSQRTRGLLFLAAGIATACGLGQDRFRVFENGVGAINLPSLRSQYGPQATRSMHPRTLWLAEGLASAISGRPFRIEAPFLRSTKAEALRSVPEIETSVIAAYVQEWDAVEHIFGLRRHDRSAA